MDVGADGMSGAVNEIIRVTFLLDVAARRAIHFPARNAAARAHRVEYSLYPGIARVPHDLEHFDHAARWSRTQKTHPGNVIVNRPRSILLPPHVKQDEVALANGNRTIGPSSAIRFSLRNASMNHCCISCSVVPPLRARRPISRKASATMASTLSR